MEVYASSNFNLTFLVQGERSVILFKGGWISDVHETMFIKGMDYILVPTLREHKAMAKLYGLQGVK